MQAIATLAFAMDTMENATAINAPADFQAGVFNTLYGVDLRAQLNACMTPDQKLANDMNTFV